jgi:amidohydrolase
MKLTPSSILPVAMLLAALGTPSRADTVRDAIDQQAEAVEAKMIAWRRDIHQHPELGNREFRTSGLVAEHLKKLGYELREKVAHTGIVAVLKGGKPGPVIAFRADMDALPVTEEVDLPFASKVRAIWRGQETGVMHACGHDAHTAVLMAAAEVFAKLRNELPGTVKLIFQPAEEGLPLGEEGGARLMITEGALENPKPEAIFGLHVTAPGLAGTIGYRAGPTMAGSDTFHITVKGRGTHGARPWQGVDPIVIASQIVLGLQTIESRQVDVTSDPSVLTVGIFNAGNRSNIISDKAELEGTLRTFNLDTRSFIMQRVKETAEGIAKSGGGEASVEWISDGYIPLINNAALTNRMVPTLQRTVGTDKVVEIKPLTPSEDFSFYAQEIPAFFYFVGITPAGVPAALVAANHSPRFQIDEAGLLPALRATVHFAFDYPTTSAK